MSLIKIDLDDGKYTALYDEEHGGITILRYGEPWRNETGDKFILSMILRIKELEDELESIKVHSKCHECDGTGEIVHNEDPENSVMDEYTYECYECGGTGEIEG